MRAVSDPQTLDWVSYLGLTPERFARYSGLEQYFAMARGTDDVQLALDMSKYFDTNYRARFETWSWLEPSLVSTVGLGIKAQFTNFTMLCARSSHP
jgi:hypothetical protein